MLFNPTEEETNLDVKVMPPSKSGLSSVLNDVGLLDDSDLEINPTTHIQAVFKNHRAGLEDAARQIGSLLVSAENDATKLRAAETILKIHGMLMPNQDEGQTKPTINITIVGNQNKTLLQVLLPSKSNT